jgi:hypothetical protein
LSHPSKKNKQKSLEKILEKELINATIVERQVPAVCPKQRDRQDIISHFNPKCKISYLLFTHSSCKDFNIAGILVADGGFGFTKALPEETGITDQIM